MVICCHQTFEHRTNNFSLSYQVANLQVSFLDTLCHHQFRLNLVSKKFLTCRNHEGGRGDWFIYSLEWSLLPERDRVRQNKLVHFRYPSYLLSL